MGWHTPLISSLLQQNEKQRQENHPATHGLASLECTRQEPETPYLNNVLRVQQSAQQVKAPASKPDHLSLIHRTYMKEKEDSCKLLSDLHIQAIAHAHTFTPKLINKQNAIFKTRWMEWINSQKCALTSTQVMVFAHPHTSYAHTKKKF